jgi:TonB family protein
MFQIYGLREQPFGVTPNPRYFYASGVHREAYASLVCSMEYEVGFAALVAEPGMGKTTLLFNLLERYRSSAHTAFLFNTQCTAQELLRSIVQELQIATAEDDRVRMRADFERFMVNQARRKPVLIVIDEAQNLDESVLESVRLLSDFETPSRKLLHIILAGQLQLAAKLARPELAQLLQRITIISRLEPLTADETAEYIEHRLQVAGYRGPQLFTPDAVAMIAEASNGVPRSINRIGFNALLLGSALQQPVLDGDIVEQVLNDLDLKQAPRRTAAAVPLIPVAAALPEEPRVAATRAPEPEPIHKRDFPVADTCVVSPRVQPAVRGATALNLAAQPQMVAEPAPKPQPVAVEAKPQPQAPVIEPMPMRKAEPAVAELKPQPPRVAEPAPKPRVETPPPQPAVHATPRPSPQAAAPALTAPPRPAAPAWVTRPAAPPPRPLSKSAPRKPLGMRKSRAPVAAALAGAAVILVALLLGVSKWRSEVDAASAPAPVVAAPSAGPVTPQADDSKPPLPQATTKPKRVANLPARKPVAPPSARVAAPSPTIIPRRVSDAPPQPTSLPRPVTAVMEPPRTPEKPADSPPEPKPLSAGELARMAAPRDFGAAKPAPSPADKLATAPTSVPQLPPKPVEVAKTTTVPEPRRSSIGELVKMVRPSYPETAKSAGIQGEVLMNVTVAKEGTVERVRVLKGNPLLAKAATDAVLQWRYRPNYVNGQPMSQDLSVKIKFVLKDANQ